MRSRRTPTHPVQTFGLARNSPRICCEARLGQRFLSPACVMRDKKPMLWAVVVPALRKPREGRGTHSRNGVGRLKGRATRLLQK
jgi:hypothetical protein